MRIRHQNYLIVYSVSCMELKPTILATRLTFLLTLFFVLRWVLIAAEEHITVTTVKVSYVGRGGEGGRGEGRGRRERGGRGEGREGEGRGGRERGREGRGGEGERDHYARKLSHNFYRVN